MAASRRTRVGALATAPAVRSAARTLSAIRWKVGDLLGWDRPDAGNGAERPTLRAGLLGTTYMAAIRPFRHLIVYPPLLKQIERDCWAGAGDPTAMGAWRSYVLHAVAQAMRRCA